MKNKKIILFFAWLVLYCFLAVNSHAQESKTIRGTITDNNGEAIIGASVTVAGTAHGTVSDLNGNFELSVPMGSTFTVSYVGFKLYQEKITTAKTIYPVTLQEDLKVLDEIVIVGYGTQKRSELTGAIASIRTSEIKDFSAKSLSEAIGGLAAGVMVTKSEGSPGSSADIIIRGAGSTNGMKPLYIVDGIAQGAGFEFNMRDVENIEILKDAGSAAIYGSKAAGGVILITTKHGKIGEKTRIDANARYGLRNITTRIKMLNRDDFFRAKDMISETPGALLGSLGISDVSELPDVDWMDLLYNTGTEQEYNVAMSGSSEKTSFYLSAGYYSEKGTYIDTKAERFTFRTNIEHQFNKHVTIGETLYGIIGKTNPSRSGDGLTNVLPFRTLPFMEAFDSEQSNGWAQTPAILNGPNLYAREYIYHANQNNGYTLRTQAYTSIDFMKGLNLRITGAGEFYGFSNQYFTEKANLGAGLNLDEMSAGAGTSRALTFNAVLTYDKKIKKHDLKVMLGTESSRYDGYNIWATAYEFPVQAAESMQLSGNVNKKAGDNIDIDRSLSFFGRVNYSYLGKYLLTANFRRDGSVRFGPNNRWGNFPSINAGWRISEENFIKDRPDWFSNAKIRASWGLLGNENNIPLFAWKSYYKNNAFNTNEGYTMVGVPNGDIKWEEVNQTDIGLDLNFFKNRLNITYDYYNRQTSDMLFQVSVPSTGGISQYFMTGEFKTAQMWVNAGFVENRGHELSVLWTDNAGDFKYNIGANASFNSNTIKDIPDEIGYIEGSNGSQILARTTNGNPMSLFYGRKVVGIFQTQEQVNEYNQKAIDANRPAGYYQQANTGVGDLIFADIDENGWIDDADQTYIGNPWPKITYGFNASLEYKGFDLNILFQGALGFDLFNAVRPYTQIFASDGNTTYDIFNVSFMGDNGLTDVPRCGFFGADGKWQSDMNTNKNYFSGNEQISANSYFVEKGNYLKLKNLVLGYSIPEKWSKKLSIEKARVYMSAQNIFTLTKYRGIDPEIDGLPTARGLDSINRYLPSRLVSFGIDLIF
ncbi:MAG: TonB-dependent receptor [Dysgonamonadaceae bacterium]|jgi:TonB-linked SusC/RagA family outer membrane protein|nr:TonB-dependent receptor [Dysgonamonadaceae bacterium]